MEDIPFVVQMSFWFFGIAISFFLLMFSPTIAYAVKKDTSKTDHSDWSDEKLDARLSYLLSHENLINDAESEAIMETQRARGTNRMRAYGHRHAACLWTK